MFKIILKVPNLRQEKKIYFTFECIFGNNLILTWKEPNQPYHAMTNELKIHCVIMKIIVFNI